MRTHLLLLSWLAILLPICAQDYQTNVKRAMELLGNDSIDNAETLLREALKLQPAIKSNAIIYQYLGRIEERRGNQQQALKHYETGLNISPSTLGILMDRAALYMRMGNEKKALADYNSVIEFNADHTGALFVRAYLYTKQHMYKPARADYEHLIQLEPANLNAHLGLILLNEKTGRPQEAMEAINALVQLHPRESRLYAVRAGMEEERKQYEPAQHDYDQAIALEPGNADYLMARASFYIHIHKHKLAKAALHRALELGAPREEVAQLLREIR